MSDEKNFNKLGLSENILSALADLGYEAPTPVQVESIPILINKDDLLAQAQTGTGKTAAFALPILTHIDCRLRKPQALVIAPTRELAIQVAEAFQSYAKHLNDFQVTSIYGGQDYGIQLRALKRGAHVIVGTPGRVIDHMRRGTLQLDALKTVVLDEADEMLKMGFIEDIGWMLEQITHSHQTALFSATLPASIQKIAKRYLNNAKKVMIKPKESTVANIEQCYMSVARNQKIEALTRYLEIEEVQAVILFVRTKTISAELAEKLQARGFAASALNGNMNQSAREKVIDRIKKGSLDIIVATDVAARGIDVERISHVINFDIPSDVDSYIHRIGRTGRAGRKGKTLMFVTAREKRLLNDIERATHNKIKRIEPPTLQEMTERRSRELAEKVINIINKSKKLTPYQSLIEQISKQGGCDPKDIAAALAYLLQEANPLPQKEIMAEEPTFSGNRKRGRKPYAGNRGSNVRRGNDSKPRPSSSRSKPAPRKKSRKG